VFIILGVATPLTGSFVISAISDTAYWRIIYLLPLPLCFGTLATLRLPNQWERQTFLQLTVALVAVALTVSSHKIGLLASENRVMVKAPWDLRLNANMVELLDTLDGSIQGQRVIAPEPLSVNLSLMRQEQLEALAYKRFVADVFNRWYYVDLMLQCEPHPQISADMIGYVIARFNPTLIIISHCDNVQITDALLDTYLQGWEREQRVGQYWLLKHTQ
jgi:hypothetical protein